MEGKIQKAGDIEFIFYNQLGGAMKRVDVFNSKSVKDIEEYKGYEIVDKYLNGDRMTFYIKPKSETDIYTDATGLTYKTSSMYVYTDRDGNYRTFSDDTKKHLASEEKHLASAKVWLERAIQHSKTEEIEMYKRWIKDSEKRIEKYNKDLMKGL